MSKNPEILIGSKNPTKVTLKDYIASGGEGTIYRHNHLCCKLYHDPSKMIPEGKILELREIKTKNVMAPKDVIYDPKTKKPIGFTMPFLSDTEYLVRIFSRKFKKDNNITPEMTVELVKNMREMLDSLHKENIIVGDYNELNTLTDNKTYVIPYAIDVDSYQTRSFLCTAIMDSIRDRTLPFGIFKDSSDWFSWAIVTFQLYTGIHPYKGNHPNYGASDLDQRMKDNISVFNKDVKMPAICRDFSVIPKAHLEWYKVVFEKNDRTKPPLPDAVFCGSYKPIIVMDASGLNIDLVHNYQDDIIDVYYFNNTRYVITTKAIYQNTTEVFKFTQKPKDILLTTAEFSDKLIIAVKSKDAVSFFTLEKEEISRINGTDFMYCNGSIYTINNGDLVENYFPILGKIKHIAKKVANIVNSSKLFQGIVIQDIFGNMMFTIPYENKKCANINVPELKGYRIIDAKRINKFCVLIAEKNGKFDRFIFLFDKTFNTYELRIDSNTDIRSVNLMVKQNGMAVTIKEDNTLEMFYDLKNSKEIKNSPIELDMPLYDGISQVLFVNDSKLQSIKS
jgi:hypothetical protein